MALPPYFRSVQAIGLCYSERNDYANHLDLPQPG